MVAKCVFQTSADVARFSSLVSHHPDDTRANGFLDEENVRARAHEVHFVRMSDSERQVVVEEAGEIPSQAFPFA